MERAKRGGTHDCRQRTIFANEILYAFNSIKLSWIETEPTGMYNEPDEVKRRPSTRRRGSKDGLLPTLIPNELKE